MGGSGLSIRLDGGLVVLLESSYEIGCGLMKVSLLNRAVVLVGKVRCFAFVCAYALYESFLLADDFEHESLLPLQFFVVSREEAGDISEVAVDLEMKFDVCVGEVRFMTEDLKVVFVSSGVEKVGVFDHMLNSGRERRDESFCRFLLMGGGGRVGGEGSLSLLFEK